MILTNVIWLGRRKKEETDVDDKFELEDCDDGVKEMYKLARKNKKKKD